jgi:hypothetical protein
MGIAGRARKVMLARDRGCAQWPVSVPQTDGKDTSLIGLLRRNRHIQKAAGMTTACLAHVYIPSSSNIA